MTRRPIRGEYVDPRVGASGKLARFVGVSVGVSVSATGSERSERSRPNRFPDRRFARALIAYAYADAYAYDSTLIVETEQFAGFRVGRPANYAVDGRHLRVDDVTHGRERGLLERTDRRGVMRFDQRPRPIRIGRPQILRDVLEHRGRDGATTRSGRDVDRVDVRVVLHH